MYTTLYATRKGPSLNYPFTILYRPTKLADAKPNRVYPTFALDLSRAIENIPNTYLDPVETTVLNIKRRLIATLERTILSAKEISKVFPQELRDFLGFKDFDLPSFLRPGACTKRINSRIFRIILLSCLINQLELEPGNIRSTTKKIRLKKTIRKQKTPSHIPQSFLCRNPSTACGEVSSKNNVTRHLKKLVWSFRCPKCEFTFKAILNKGILSRCKLIDPGKLLSELINTLWRDPDCNWDLLMQKTGLSESDLASYAFYQGLSVEKKPASLIQKFNTFAHEDTQRGRKLESAKAAVLDFIQRFPSADRKLLISSRETYSAYRYVRLFDPEWVSKHASRFSIFVKSSPYLGKGLA